MRGRRPSSIASQPVFIGALAVLLVFAAVLLAYRANRGLPFVPVTQLEVDVPNAARLVVGNEVREGGFRIGQVTKIAPVPGNRSGAQLTLSLDNSAAPVPADSTVKIRPRSALGLKYVELVRGRSERELPDGATITADASAVGPELDDFFSTFDEPTRKNVERNLDYLGTGVAGRGDELNRTLEALPELLGDLPPVMRVLSDPDTKLARLVHEAGDTVRVIAPLSKQFARGFSGMADTFEGASRDPQALKDTIALSPATLDEGIRSLPDTRPFLSRLAGLSDEVQGTARELRASLPAVNRALAAGTPVLRRTPKFTGRLQGTLRALRDLAKSPTTDQSIAGLSSTMKALNPLLRYLGPHVTVCNYFTYMWTFLADHLSDEDATGTVERIQTKLAPLAQANSLGTIGAAKPSSTVAAALHQSDYGRAVDENGNADCEAGQRGYPTEAPFTNHRTPGNQGPTFKGRARVPAGQSYSAEPTGIAPPVLP
ncbi:MAG: phospholipid/cholesterol/gamma-HCH transport system substrate-binding protein [Solirubrobacteraceae bacterium]|jgi:virulence factor Mce-like protein|nr:phospholipid/cholesterol/gamma-HCH transport system substrate-binding protein [Solirubrobacteraceae bacterium]